MFHSFHRQNRLGQLELLEIQVVLAVKTEKEHLSSIVNCELKGKEHEVGYWGENGGS